MDQPEETPENPPPNHFDESVAAGYDDSTATMAEPAVLDPTLDLLTELAAGGETLELGIGTGRVALPLAARGVPVHGIDLSPQMVARLRAKPGGDAIPVAIGDFATTRVEGSFSLAYLIFNTITNLTTQDAQVDCFRNVAEHLAPGGRFLIEVGLPELDRLTAAGDAGETGNAEDIGHRKPAGPFPPAAPGNTVLFRAGPPVWGFDVYDTATQAMSSNHVEIVDGRGTFRSIPFRYVWPAEMDLMARLAGLRPYARWEDWDRTPFTSRSRRIVAVWEKPAAPA
ncbi:class I SAM-dependent methyltransferase [Streptomyces calidiresistens]|uniref:Methyltransferase domain-containing protein n=1 Tax=Streptomyces calidiresistens TaxID=1485586 RepID=A0A7W3T6L1_9ACTN|nr:class I SAM-dependent methyltransferase [Streptomyces calidiresistens]MBB0231859.1 methyltransferase domain-containing protein [Streptomyces calidiresistens]